MYPESFHAVIRSVLERRTKRLISAFQLSVSDGQLNIEDDNRGNFDICMPGGDPGYIITDLLNDNSNI
jgi:hypothetical protein